MKYLDKNKFIAIIITFLILSTFSSCNSLYLKHSGILDDKPELKRISNDTKNIIFLPIHHIGKKEYYNNLSKKVDSLTLLGYVTFYEEVTTKLKEKTEYIPLAKKFRKIQGDFNAGNGYLDSLNNNSEYELINQPKFHEMGIDTLTAVNADLTLERIISEFELNNGEIKLNECDEKTDLGSNYNCESLNKKLRQDFRENYILGMRNINLANLINESESNKIFVIYGASHYKGLLKELKKIDSNWAEKK